jgi:hypothetical protein
VQQWREEKTRALEAEVVDEGGGELPYAERAEGETTIETTGKGNPPAVRTAWVDSQSKEERARKVTSFFQLLSAL